MAPRDCRVKPYVVAPLFILILQSKADVHGDEHEPEADEPGTISSIRRNSFPPPDSIQYRTRRLIGRADVPSGASKNSN